jgi:cell division septation protein DedD
MGMTGKTGRSSALEGIWALRISIRRFKIGVVGRALFFLPVLPVFPVLPALSQTDPRLIEVIRLAQEGQGDSARVRVQRMLAATPPSDTLYPQIVYTQAMVADDAADMRRQLQRVAVEHSSSSWADDALLRLVQLDYASSNLEGASRHVERIRLDYPGSALLPQAAYWAARTYFDQKKPELACRWIGQGLSGSSGNIELQNQLGYLNQRCAQFAAAGRQGPDTQTRPRVAADSPQVVAAAPLDTTPLSPDQPDTTRPRPTPTPPPPAAPPPVASSPPVPPRAAPTGADTVARPAPAGTRYRIQITAVRNVATARSAASKVRARGFDVVTVEEAGLYKVRIGNYATKAEAIAALPEVKAKLGGSPFVVTES